MSRPVMSTCMIAASLLGVAGRADSATARHRMALVIGNTAYNNYPALPACAASAGLVASQLGKAGFSVTQRDDVSNGELGAAFAAFAAQAAAAPVETAVAYVCGYGGSLNGRDFILPVSAVLSRPSDVMTEGLVARSALSFARGRAGASILALDLIAEPKLGLAPPAGSLATDALPETASVAIAVETRPPSAATLFAADLAAALAAPDVDLATLLPNLANKLSGAEGVTIAGVKGAAKTPPLVAAPAAQSPAAAQQTAPAARTAAPVAALPGDAALTAADRRRVQIALAGLGYYDGRLDGIFGADSRAAIRRYQHEIGAPMTGLVDAAQANRLVGGAH
jgi:uncharacterized caspase-like protein